MNQSKKIFAAMLAIGLSIASTFISIAAPENINSKAKLKNQIQEINQYLLHHQKAIDIKNQINVYQIPLSDGTTATVTQGMNKISDLSNNSSSENDDSKFTAKLGTWDVFSTYKFSGSAEIKVTSTLKVTYVPDLNSADNKVPDFTVYNGRVSAIPPQGYTISGSSASTQEKCDRYYITTGYVGFSAKNNLNYYFTQTITYVGNVGDDRNKLWITLNMSLI